MKIVKVGHVSAQMESRNDVEQSVDDVNKDVVFKKNVTERDGVVKRIRWRMMEKISVGMLHITIGIYMVYKQIPLPC